MLKSTKFIFSNFSTTQSESATFDGPALAHPTFALEIFTLMELTEPLAILQLLLTIVKQTRERERLIANKFKWCRLLFTSSFGLEFEFQIAKRVLQTNSFFGFIRFYRIIVIKSYFCIVRWQLASKWASTPTPYLFILSFSCSLPHTLGVCVRIIPRAYARTYIHTVRTVWVCSTSMYVHDRWKIGVNPFL